ncbi:MAG: hypothetical protein QXM73_00920 [Candidatus Nezhaarchaeales archaeon]
MKSTLSYEIKRKAVSTMIATLILIGVTAAMGSFIYWYATSYAKSMSRISSITITEAKISKTSTGTTNVLVSLRNQGTTIAELFNVTIYDDEGTPIDILSKNEALILPPPSQDRKIVLNPGSSVTIVYVGKLNVTLGNTYTIVVATSQGAQQVTVECTSS